MSTNPPRSLSATSPSKSANATDQPVEGGGTGERAAKSHSLPKRIGPSMADGGTAAADSADCHSLAIPRAVAASVDRELKTLSSAVIQNVLGAGTGACGAAPWLAARAASFCSCGSILPAKDAATLAAV